MTTHVKAEKPDAVIIDEILEEQSQVILDDKCLQIHQLLESSFANKVNAIRELEAIRWTGEWTYDKHWNDLMRGEADADLGRLRSRISFSWVTYVNVVRGFRIEDEFIAERTYQDLRTAGILIDVINLYNASASENQRLPLPKNASQCQPYASTFGRGNRSRDLTGFAPQFRARMESNSDSFPIDAYLPPHEQTTALTAWRDVWLSLPSDKQFDKRGKPQPPTQAASRAFLAALEDDADTSPIERINRLTSVDPITEVQREEARKASEKLDAETKEATKRAYEWVQDQKSRGEHQRIADELRRKEQQELDEIKSYVTEYNASLNASLKSLNTLLRFLRKVSHIHGTQYLSEMRAFDLGMNSVHEDTLRLRRMSTIMVEIGKLAASNDPPCGVDPETINAEFEEVLSNIAHEAE